MKIQRYGWIPQLPDHRDYKFTAPVVVAPSDMRGGMPPVYDQGQLGSCTANAIAGAVQYMAMKEGVKDAANPSRLFIYYHERAIEGTVPSDSGAMLRDGAKTVVDKGWPDESLWPYDISQFAVCPPHQVWGAATKNKAIQYSKVDQTAAAIGSALTAGYPVVFGFTVYESFESDAVAKTGMVPMPTKFERAVGGHAVCIVGYLPHQHLFIVRNSWSAAWGDKGYFYMPEAYVTSADLANDFWVFQKVS